MNKKPEWCLYLRNLVTIVVIGWVDPDNRAAVEGNWLFLKPISIAFHDTPFSFHWSLNSEWAWLWKVAARPVPPGAPGQKQNSRFLSPAGPHTDTLTHCRSALASGAGDTGQRGPGDHPWLPSLKVRSIVSVSSPASDRGSITSLPRDEEPCLVNSQLTQGWPWFHLEMGPWFPRHSWMFASL